jgi:hypothetical protein
MFDSAKDIISGLILIFAISSFVLCPMVNAIGKDAVTENAQAIEINLNNLPAVNALRSLLLRNLSNIRLDRMTS